MRSVPRGLGGLMYDLTTRAGVNSKRIGIDQKIELKEIELELTKRICNELELEEWN